MNQQDFLKKWNSEIPMYTAWGRFVTSVICKEIKESGRDINNFLKQNPKPRVKDENSLLDKAFYRENKNYRNPYEEIEDKVGCRFVVLLIEHINEIINIIQDQDSWEYESCRNFHTEKEKDPLLFTYQSVHYVVRSRTDFEYKGVFINAGTPCEIQIRTLLQHAYAELTHDAVYKAKTIVIPEVHRTIAKSMALIETTDDFFSGVNNKLNSNLSDRIKFQEKLDVLYKSHIGISSKKPQKSSIIILDVFDKFIDNDFPNKLEVFIKNEKNLVHIVKNGAYKNPFYCQSVILFVYYLIKKKRHTLIDNWPLNVTIIETLAVDMGISLETN